MATNHRIMFTFDERSLNTLKRIREAGHYNSMATAVRDSIRIRRTLQQQAAEGFTEIVVRNPRTGEARVIVNDFDKVTESEES